MLRIHFTGPDVARVRVASRPDPLWELVFSLFRLRQGKNVPLAFGRWRADAVKRADTAALGLLLPLVTEMHFPDFLTPAASADGLDAGIEALLSTPTRRLRAEMTFLGASRGGLPAAARPLADGNPGALKQLAGAVRTHHQAVVAPYGSQAQAHLDADRALRSKAFLDGGGEGLLNSYRPLMRWSFPVLEVDFPVEQDVHLDGRGLLLVPSFLSWRTPDALRDTSLPPVLVYPVEHDLALIARCQDPGGPSSLEALIGLTRSQVLEQIGDGRTTSELARRIGVSPASISQHTGVLREAGLIRTTRTGRVVLHTLTPLGSALLAAA